MSTLDALAPARSPARPGPGPLPDALLREQELPNVGELWLVDPETGRRLRVDTRSEKLRRRFETAAAAERAALGHSFTAAGVRHVVLSTSGDWLRVLVPFLGRPGAGR